MEKGRLFVETPFFIFDFLVMIEDWRMPINDLRRKNYRLF